MIVHEGEESHDELAVHAVGDTAVTRDRFAKVFDLESTLQARRKESPEGSNERGKRSESQDVELDRLNPESLVQAKQLERVGLRGENRVRNTFQASQSVRAQVVDRANEILVAHEELGHEVTEANRADPRTDESLDGLLRRELNQLCASEADTTDVGKDVIRDDQCGGEEEPDHALENVVHHKVSLNHNQIQSHMGPSKLSELKPVVTLLQGSDEEYEAYELTFNRGPRKKGRGGGTNP